MLFFLLQISAGEQKTVESSFVFLTPGRYCLDLICHGETSSSSSTSLSTSSTLPQSTNAQQPDKLTSTDHVNSSQSAQRQNWRYIPAIELSVKES